MADKSRDDDDAPRSSAAHTTTQRERAREDREQQGDNQAPGAVEMDPAAAARSDGWVTDTTPTPEPQHVIDRNARESAAALQPNPVTVNATGEFVPERPLAPGVLESSQEMIAERAEEQLDEARKGASEPAHSQTRRP